MTVFILPSSVSAFTITRNEDESAVIVQSSNPSRQAREERIIFRTCSVLYEDISFDEGTGGSTKKYGATEGSDFKVGNRFNVGVRTDVR